MCFLVDKKRNRSCTGIAHGVNQLSHNIQTRIKRNNSRSEPVEPVDNVQFNVSTRIAFTDSNSAQSRRRRQFRVVYLRVLEMLSLCDVVAKNAFVYIFSLLPIRRGF